MADGGGLMLGGLIRTEFTKLRRSPAPPATLAGLSLGPLGLALLMWIAADPERAAGFGLLGDKASLTGLELTWAAYSTWLVALVGIGGMLVLPFVVAYVFGREYTEATLKNMLTLPVRRPWFVIAKLVVALAWWLVLVVVVAAEGVVIAALLGLPGISAATVAPALGRVLVAAGISFLLVPIVVWVTLIGRGMLAPVAFALAMLALGNLLGHTGWAVWFPWSIIPSLIGLVGAPTDLPPGSYAVVTLTFILGIALSAWQIDHTDVSG